MSREMVFYGGQCVLDAESEYLSEMELAQHVSANAEVGQMQAEIDRLRAENAELRKQLAAEHDLRTNRCKSSRIGC